MLSLGHAEKNVFVLSFGERLSRAKPEEQSELANSGLTRDLTSGPTDQREVMGGRRNQIAQTMPW